MSRKGVPVTIDGKKYPSQSAAARALGVTRQAIHDKLTRHARGAISVLGRPPTPFVLDGVRATAREHAKRLGVDLAVVYARKTREVKS